ncbi:hypothetical protein LTR10_024237 [Elasticomyces elasticus]|uniref:Heterokaryon incompatibility domain-containing protein n=1 Tax=Exophiala sideris TaxID=1016849 RepID=A0ABR0JIK8_9EURO|nr:hypothetical protein LTR10_024237 [Elasticomyces elasticus]KAK5034417.1 hypothetical protein LTS07_003338 [Exophiala sideris]KAK5042714.1 hypothetical protein LTR13_001562 [Exophiala sideris]KAK5065797.1 hypothetical protein LTR69_003347 [Exophiala sideris]KAK5185742.1 hypothetical protein LTR44_001791 [Eurotiomycetes sp. CCFEE 6388]
MDHILSTDELDAYGQYIPEIPWLGYDHRPSQDLSAFEDYALQRGWSQGSLIELKEGRLAGLDQGSLKPFLQSWFSIGLCEAALGRGLDRDSFIVSQGPNAVFTSKSLRQIAVDLDSKFENAPGDDSNNAILGRFARILNAASLWNRMLTDPQLFINANLGFCDETYHSIMRMFTLLGTSLQYTGQYLARWSSADNVVGGKCKARLQNHWWLTPTMQESLQERMTQRGWCPYVRTMLNPFDNLVAEYAAVVGPPATHFDHHSCSAAECVRHNIEESTYKPLHAMPNCQCQFVRPRLERIADILNKDQIPLMDFNNISGSDTDSVIDVVAFDAGNSAPETSGFYAVSHVWSGGFGSVSEDGLPQCTMDFLKRYMGSSDSSKLVWIDSLCIPRDKRLRKMSIRSINKVYSNASATLVLDPELMRTSSSTIRQMLMWITTAAWMQRMWTLPEGRHSQDPYIAFKDRAVKLRDVLLDADKKDLDPVTGLLMGALVGLFSHAVKGLQFIHQSLCYRTTSKREDETPALATLFGIDPHPILNTKSLDERMAIFWKSLGRKISLPINIIFLRVPKLPIQGLHWAPSTLLNAGKQPSLIQPPDGDTSYNVELSDNGTLTGQYVVIRLSKRASISIDKFNPIRLAINPDPGSIEVAVALFTLLSYNQAGTALETDSKSLDNIDAFAVNVTKLEARSGMSLANELAASVHTVLALTSDNNGGQQSSDDRMNHRFTARYILQLSPVETAGNELLGYVGWARISIS